MEKIVNWIKDNKVEFAILVAILAAGAFFRLYKIADYMTYLGDEGRDVTVVRRLLVYFDPILIGPGTSIGNMYLGPLYYYLIAPSLWLAGFSPVGPSVFVALVGVLTVFLVWKFGREWFGKVAGLTAAFFYAISPTVIIFSRSSWNPNIMPFFALLSIYSVWKIWSYSAKARLPAGQGFAGQGKWLVILGISFAFCLQSHYLGLLLLPTLGIFLFLTKKNKKFWHYSLLSVLLFLFLMSPLVIFDARHGWRNFAAMKNFFAVRQETVSIKPWKAVPKIFPIFEKINSRLVGGRDINAGVYLTIVIFVFAIWLLVNRKKEERMQKDAYILIFTWLAFALLGLGLYKQEIYDHYYGFFFPAPFFLIGALVQNTFKIARKAGKILIILGLLYLAFVNFKQNPLRYPPNMQLRRAMEVAQKVSHESGGKEFNFAVIAERNYESGYKYFLQMWGTKIVDIDAQKPDTITGQLFVVCEMEKVKCDPTHNPKAEVANFGWSKIDTEWTVFGTTFYKLVHSE